MIQEIVKIITGALNPLQVVQFLPDLLKILESGVMKDGMFTEETLIAVQVEVEKLRNA